MANIFIFAFDLTEASQIRRIKSIQILGYEVQSAAFRRGNMNVAFQPEWPNVDLGYVPNENYSKRIIGILRGIWRMVWQRQLLKKADIVIARNFDLLIIAWATRLLTGTWRTPLVYECLDIHGLFTRNDVAGAVMRWFERRLLTRIKLLIVSSPGFVTHYFSSVQGYQGPHITIENKLWFDGPPSARPKKRNCTGVLTIGWVGSIRCAPSMKILMDTADHFDDRIAIHIHGNVHQHVLPDFDSQIASRANVTYFGPYNYPDDLALIYADCDMVWAQDLWQRGANSDWLLPNRIYEASWFGCPSIAVTDTETGRNISRNNLGFTLATPSADALIDLVDRVDPSTINEVSDQLLAKDDAAFMLHSNDVKAALELVFQYNS